MNGSLSLLEACERLVRDAAGFLSHDAVRQIAQHDKDEMITTTDGSLFTFIEHVDLARLIYKRFGHDLGAAAAAWRRMLQNSTTEAQFLALVEHDDHTHYCGGWCQDDP